MITLEMRTFTDPKYVVCRIKIMQMNLSFLVEAINRGSPNVRADTGTGRRAFSRKLILFPPELPFQGFAG